ncbi:MAG: TspO/MBR family protein [Candidatus Bathyarchaeia archaeon]
MERDGVVKYLQMGNLVGYVSVIVVNSLANALPLNGKTTGELSDLYPNLFTPAAYVFGIWGIIYLLLGAFSIYQALPRNRDKEFIKRIGWLFIASCVFNIAWIFLWHYEYILLSLIDMFALLSTLILIYLRLDVGLTDAPRRQELLVNLPFSVYLGWITVAPIANVAAYLVDLGWPSYGNVAIIWTVSLITVAVLLTLVNIWTRRDIPYSLVLIWALGGIIVKQLETGIVPYAAGVGIAAILLGLIVKRWKQGTSTKTSLTT